jgi:hypothetical protein
MSAARPTEVLRFAEYLPKTRTCRHRWRFVAVGAVSFASLRTQRSLLIAETS